MRMDMLTDGDDMINIGNEPESPQSSTLSLFTSLDDMEQALLVPTQNDSDKSRSKKFLFRLVQALHSSGNLSYKTEETIQRVAKAFQVFAICAVLPVSANITFNASYSMSPKNSETYMCRLSFGYDCWKWVRVNELCHKIIKLDVDLYTAEKELQDIEESGPVYSPATVCLAYGSMSAATALLFFGGGWTDGTVAFVLGCFVYLMGVLCGQVPGLAEVECFVSPFLLTCLSYLISTYVLPGGECEYAQLFGGVVWLLPGLTIVIALLEIYSKMIVYGSARLVFGVSMASQMGFGIVMACALCYPNLNIPESFTAGCVSPFPWQLKIPFMLVAAVGGAVILNVAPLHFPGVLLVSGCGQTVGYLVEHYIRPTAASTFRDNVAPVLAAVAVTAVARLVGRRHYHMYLIAGLLLLVPGGIGVKGMSSMWSGDMESGIVFTFKMIMVGISLAIGVFMALLPKMRWLQSCMECMSGRGGRKSVKGRYFPIGESKDERMKMLSSAKAGSREGEGVALRTSSAGGTTTWK